jgi:hypothetical protein
MCLAKTRQEKAEGAAVKKANESILDKDWFWLVLLGFITVLFCQHVLFTEQIIRASDVITQFFWGTKAVHGQSLVQYLQSLPAIFQANWEPLSDGGRTLEGGWNAIGLLVHRYLIQHFFPFPSSIAWLAVLSLLWGGIGTFYYCRLIGIGRFGAFAAGLLFALCTENVSLINAGHIQKIETISWFPWVFLFLEKALRSGRLFHYAMTACLLGIQFFNMHWQISFYSCLAVGAYWLFHVTWRFLEERGDYAQPFRKDILLATVMVVLFFTTIAMSFAPLFSWSKQSERGGGMSQEEGMSWSMPPEEILTYIVPGLVGLSRQEAGDVPETGQVYYWGRMRFTQTSDYLGLLPWLLLPLPLILRRDRYTWFFTLLMGATLIMALGKYTFFYQFLFDHVPGFSTFRVPKMILFLFAFGAAVLMGKGFDILAEETANRKTLKHWLFGGGILAALTGLFWLFLALGSEKVLSLATGVINLPTRYQADASLISERYGNMLRETGLAFGFICAHLAVFIAWYKKWLPTRFLLPLITLFLLFDLWRVNSKFLVLTPPPQADRKVAKNDIVRFLEPRIDHYRMQPLNSENAHYYADYGLANISAYVTISERRYKEFLDNFSLVSPMPDIMNLKYLIMASADYEAQKNALADKYTPVFTSTVGSVVLENRTVLPKAWLVPSVAIVPDAEARIAIMYSSPRFNPALVGLVESSPPIAMAPYGQAKATGSVAIHAYESNKIALKATHNDNALLIVGEKYYRWWKATVDGKETEIYPVNHILRGVYLTPGTHKVEFVFDPLPFKIGKYLTLASFAFFALMLGLEWVRGSGQRAVKQ